MPTSYEIFPTSPDPQLSAIALDDHHLDLSIERTACLIRRPSLWMKAAPSHARWVRAHHVACVAELYHRTGRAHSAYTGVRESMRVRVRHFKFSRPDSALSAFPVHDAFRWVLLTLWATSKATWTNRKPPPWTTFGDVYELHGRRYEVYRLDPPNIILRRDAAFLYHPHLEGATRRYRRPLSSPLQGLPRRFLLDLG